MGNYERTLKEITRLENYINTIEDMEEIAECNNRIGELNGYLEELAEVDGYNSYEEMQIDESRYDV